MNAPETKVTQCRTTDIGLLEVGERRVTVFGRVEPVDEEPNGAILPLDE
jgi:hypothetical protein